MKFAHPEISKAFDTECGLVPTLIIENQDFLVRLLEDINNQQNGQDGCSVLSFQNKILPLDKRLELISQFVPFDVNTKSLLNKISADLEKQSVSDEFYEETTQLLNKIESFLYKISFSYNCDIHFQKINSGALIKSMSPFIETESESLAEKLLDYFELVTEFENKKLFITLNLRSFISDEETELFMQSILSHGFNVLMIESSEHKRLLSESRYIIDSDLCEIE